MGVKEYGSWHDIVVRDKNGRTGVIIDDNNTSFTRYLDIQFSDGEKYTLVLSNVRMSQPDPLGIEWEYNPGYWAMISDGGKTPVQSS
jgi:hypothetical protein